MSGSWLQLSFKAPAPALDTISNFLIERGAPGVVLERDEVRAFFARSRKTSALKRDIRRFLKGIRGIYSGIDEQPLRWTTLRNKDWNNSWRRFFTPQKIGRHFWVTPPWMEPPPSRGRKVITIEPGMAFGTGTHPTTRGCLEFVEEAALALNGSALIALDVGTGSGILAIALAKMGASEVFAIDNDPLALKVAHVNVRRNRVGKVVTLSNFGLGRVRKLYTVVAANLTAETLIDLADALKKKVSPDGYLILSGILRPKAGDVVRHFCPAPFSVTRQINQKEWTSLLLRKTG